MEELLYKELGSLQESAKISRAGVFLNAPMNTAIDFGLRSRFASRMYLKIDNFEVSREKQLYNALLEKIPWGDFLKMEETFKVQAVVNKKNYHSNIFKSSHYASLLCKDAISDAFTKRFDRRPHVDKTDPDKLFFLYLDFIGDNKINATLYLDLVGPITHREYRLDRFDAPLRENLAAAIVENIDWDEKAPFYDLMCGSGTLVIEALIKKLKLPTSYLKIIDRKAFPFQTVKGINFEIAPYEDEIDTKLRKTDYIIKAFDISPKSLDIARTHVEEAMLENFVEFACQDARSFVPQEDHGVVVMNPPYGIRMGDEEEAEALYHELGEAMKKNMKGFKVYIFTGKPQLRKKISLQTSKRIPLMNGDIECRLFEYAIF